MPMKKDTLKSMIRPRIIALLNDMDGRATLDGELITRSECAAVICAVFMQNFERAYSVAARQLGEREWLHETLPIVVREICEEERARGAQ